MSQPNVRISGVAKADLKRLQLALQTEFGINASGEEIASALLHGITVSQSAGMLLAYNRDMAEKGGQQQS